MRKIHISEEQLNELKKKISEAYTVDATPEVEANGGNLKSAWENIKSKNPQLSQQADSGEVTVGVNPKGMDESKHITKKQIKEAKIANLKKNSVRYSKKDLK